MGDERREATLRDTMGFGFPSDSVRVGIGSGNNSKREGVRVLVDGCVDYSR